MKRGAKTSSFRIQIPREPAGIGIDIVGLIEDIRIPVVIDSIESSFVVKVERLDEFSVPIGQFRDWSSIVFCFHERLSPSKDYRFLMRSFASL